MRLGTSIRDLEFLREMSSLQDGVRTASGSDRICDERLVRLIRSLPLAVLTLLLGRTHFSQYH